MTQGDGSDFVGFVSDAPVEWLRVWLDQPEPTPPAVVDNLTYGQRRAGNEPTRPLLLTNSLTGRAAAFESVGLTTEPFSPRSYLQTEGRRLTAGSGSRGAGWSPSRPLDFRRSSTPGGFAFSRLPREAWWCVRVGRRRSAPRRPASSGSRTEIERRGGGSHAPLYKPRPAARARVKMEGGRAGRVPPSISDRGPRPQPAETCVPCCCGAAGW
jgi:hypothetical protein